MYVFHGEGSLVIGLPRDSSADAEKPKVEVAHPRGGGDST